MCGFVVFLCLGKPLLKYRFDVCLLHSEMQLLISSCLCWQNYQWILALLQFSRPQGPSFRAVTWLAKRAFGGCAAVLNITTIVQSGFESMALSLWGERDERCRGRDCNDKSDRFSQEKARK